MATAITEFARDYGSFLGAGFTAISIYVSMLIGTRALRAQQDHLFTQLIVQQSQSDSLQNQRTHSMKLWYRGEIFRFAAALCNFTEISMWVTAAKLRHLKGHDEFDPARFNLQELAYPLRPRPFNCDPSHALDLGSVEPAAVRDAILHASEVADSALVEVSAILSYTFKLVEPHDDPKSKYGTAIAEAQLRNLPRHFEKWQSEFLNALDNIEKSLSMSSEQSTEYAIGVNKFRGEVAVVSQNLRDILEEYIPEPPLPLEQPGEGDGKKADARGRSTVSFGLPKLAYTEKASFWNRVWTSWAKISSK